MGKSKRDIISKINLVQDIWSNAPTDTKDYFLLQLLDLTSLADDFADEYLKIVLKSVDFAVHILVQEATDASTTIRWVQPFLVKVMEDGALPANHDTGTVAGVNVRAFFDSKITTDFGARTIGQPRAQALLDPTPGTYLARFAFKFGITWPSDKDLIQEKSKGISYGIYLLLMGTGLHTTNTHDIWSEWNRKVKYKLVPRKV